MSRQLEDEARDREPDRDLVQADAKVAGERKAGVRGQQEEGARRVGVARTHGEDGAGESEHPRVERSTRPEHLDRRVEAASERLEVEAGRQDARSAAEHDKGPCLLGRVESGADLGDARHRKRVDFAIVQREGRDPPLDLDAHRGLPACLHGLLLHEILLAGAGRHDIDRSS